MNDTLPALPPEQTQAFHHHLNSIKPPIQLTIEEESLGTILFLDTMVTRHDIGSLSHHRVPQEDSHRPLSGFSSHHTLAHKVTITHTMLTKQDLQFPARQRCGQGAFLQVLETTGYPKTLFNQHWRVFSPHSTSQQDMPRATIVQTILIYQIPCGTCGRAYIGQTNWTLGQQFNEHKRS